MAGGGGGRSEGSTSSTIAIDSSKQSSRHRGHRPGEKFER